MKYNNNKKLKFKNWKFDFGKKIKIINTKYSYLFIW